MHKILNVPSKEDILRYYIEENHTKADSARHFGVSETQFTRYVTRYGIKKPQSLKAKFARRKYDFSDPAYPASREVANYFIAELHTIPECLEHFGMGESEFRGYLDFHGIKKSHRDTQLTIERLNMGRYGVKYHKDPSAVEKAKKTNLERYGCENPSCSPEVIQRIKASESMSVPPENEMRLLYIDQQMSHWDLADHYGVSRGTVEKWLNSYGIKKTSQQIIASRRKTCRGRYGVENTVQSPQVRAKIEAANVRKYGVRNPTVRHIRHYDAWVDRDLFIAELPLMGRFPAIVDIAEHYNVHGSAAVRKVHEFGVEDLVDFKPKTSQYETEIVNFLKNDLGITNIEQSNRDILDGFELDIYLPDYKFAIEFNGEYWHSDAQKKYQDHGGRSTRHQSKSLAAEKKGVFVFHIFEHEWDDRYIAANPRFKNSKENIKNRLRAMLGVGSVPIAARKCDIAEVGKDEKKAFMDEYHIQGADHRSTVAYGLFHSGELVACMSFCKSKFDRYDWELSRFCVKHGYSVQGGASRLFTHFLRDKVASGERIVSYSDITKTKGDVYKALGFSCESIGSPNYWWVNLDNYDVRTRYQEQAAGEVDRMHEAGYVRICDCGTRTWVYVKP